MFTQILAAIAAIPELIKAIRELTSYFQKLEANHWLQDKTKALQDLEKAKTPEDYKNAAQELSNTLRGL